MAIKTDSSLRGVRLLGAALLAWSAILSLVSCATTGTDGGQPGQRADMVTESDEPDGRRRARIRLELAVGYFEQGQTTVALDELKQALAADPSFGDAYNLRGLVYMRLGDFRLAEDSFRRAITLAPGNANTQHNLAWMMCQQGRYPEAATAFSQALANPQYAERAKTLMAQGLCHMNAGQRDLAEQSLARAYEIDAGNPVTGYNLSLLLYQRSELVRAQFYIRRINNSDFANAETLWLGVRVEHKLGNRDAEEQLGSQLRKRHPQARETALLDKGAFDEQ